jgi:AraC-like DNA-binding protein
MLASPPMAGLKKRDGITPRTDPPRGILNLRPDEVEGVARYWSSPDLEPFVEHHWVVRWDSPEPELAEVVPQPSIHIVLQAGASEVVGLSRGRITRLLVGRGRMVGTRFRPGAFRPFVKSPVWTLAGKSARLTEVFGPRANDLEELVLREDDDRRAIAVVEEFLRNLEPRADADMLLAGRIVAHIAAERGVTRVDHLATEFRTSQRALQRLFREYVGASPKRVIRDHRLLEATDRVAREGKLDWAEFALELGYADQAHFIRDFKALVGRTPAEYARRLDHPNVQGR